MAARVSRAPSASRHWRLAWAAVPFAALAVLLAPYLEPGRAPASARNDIHTQHAPNVLLLAHGWREDGELPRWNAQDFAGTPLVADPQAGVYNPVHWLLATAGSVHAFGWLIAASAAAGALGMLLYAREIGCGWAGASAGAVQLVLGGSALFRLVALGHLVMAPLFLVPWALLGIAGCARGASVGRCGSTAGVLAWIVVWMHPQLLVYTALFLLAAGVAAIWRSERPARAFASLSATAVGGAGLSAVHWLPVLALRGEFTRSVPALRGAPAADAPDVGLADLVLGTSADPEAWFHLGAVALAVAALGALAWGRGTAHRSHARFHAGAALAIVAGALWLGDAATLGGLFRHPERLLVLAGVPLAALVALGVDALRAESTPLRRVAAALVVAALAGEGGLALRPHVRTAPEPAIGALPARLRLPDDLDRDARLAEPLRVATERGIPPLAKRRLGLESLTGYNPLIPWRFWVYVHFASGLDPRVFDPSATTVPVRRFAHPALFDLLGVTHFLYAPRRAGGPWRWERAAAPLPRAYLVPDVVGVPDAERDAAVASTLAALERLRDLDPRAQVMLHGDVAPVLAAAGAGPGAALAPYREVPVRVRRPNRIALSLDTERPAVLVLNEPYFPGWRARDGGAEIPVLRANVLFRALVLAPGAHEIELEFAPRPWVFGRAASALSFGLLLALGVAAGVRRRTRPDAARSR